MVPWNINASRPEVQSKRTNIIPRYQFFSVEEASAFVFALISKTWACCLSFHFHLVSLSSPCRTILSITSPWLVFFVLHSPSLLFLLLHFPDRYFRSKNLPDTFIPVSHLLNTSPMFFFTQDLSSNASTVHLPLQTQSHYSHLILCQQQ